MLNLREASAKKATFSINTISTGRPTTSFTPQLPVAFPRIVNSTSNSTETLPFEAVSATNSFRLEGADVLDIALETVIKPGVPGHHGTLAAVLDGNGK